MDMPFSHDANSKRAEIIDFPDENIVRVDLTTPKPERVLTIESVLKDAEECLAFIAAQAHLRPYAVKTARIETERRVHGINSFMSLIQRHINYINEAVK